MKVNVFDAHDRYQHFIKQDFDISACCQNLIDQRPFGEHPFYIFAHARTDDDGVTKRLIWQPRLTRPKSQPNSMLFKAYPGTDIVKVLWMIPARELFLEDVIDEFGNKVGERRIYLYRKGNVTASPDVEGSIEMYLKHRNKLEAPEPDDLDDASIDAIYRHLSMTAKGAKFGKI